MFRRLTAWLDRFESPSGMLTTSEQTQVDRLRHTRERWLDTIAQLAVAQKHAHQLTEAASRLESQARQAVLADRDDLAIAALTRLQHLRPRLEALNHICADLADRATALRQQFAAQQAQLQRFRQAKPLIQAAWEADQRAARP